MTNHRGFRRGTPVVSWRRLAAATAAVALMALTLPLAAGSPQGAQAGAKPQDPQAGAKPQDPQPPRPVFRVGANAVRVDVFATRKGVPVEDLTADDFELFEDNVAQKVDAFEHVKIEMGGDPTTRVEPRNVRESEQMAADPRARLFVLFLDFYHTHQSASFNVTRPLMNLMDKIVGPQDLIAVMTPDMSAKGIMFTRRTDQITSMLASFKWWGQRGREGFSDDPVEQMYTDCYPSNGVGGMTSSLALGMIERRREKLVLDALNDLVLHLGGIREERKAILLVSEGWRLFKPDPSMQASTSTTPVTRDPLGRIIGTNPNNTGVYAYNRQCEQDRIMLSGIDDERRFRDIMDLANRVNASFYPIEPRGLPVFDTEMGPNAPVGVIADSMMLQQRHESLMTIADNTDGVAVINSNDISGGLKRVVSDLSSYYLLGYTSTNAKADGRYRSIKVRVKKPGIDVRARKGYKAPTAEEFAMMTAASAPPPVVDEAAMALSKAVGSLEATAREAPIRVSVSPGWWTPAADPSKGKPAGAEPALWILGEVDAKSRTGDDWSQGGEADVAITGGSDQTPLVKYTVPIPPGAPRFLTRFPRSLDDIWLDPGTYTVRVRVKSATGGIPITDSTKFDVAAPKKADTMLVGPPLYFRRGSAASSPEQPTSDRRYRRTERVVVQLSTTLAPDAVGAELLDRSGKVMPLPVAAAVVDKESVRWVRAEVQLAPLTVGDYVLRITTEKGASKIQMLAPFRIVP